MGRGEEGDWVGGSRREELGICNVYMISHGCHLSSLIRGLELKTLLSLLVPGTKQTGKEAEDMAVPQGSPMAGSLSPPPCKNSTNVNFAVPHAGCFTSIVSFHAHNTLS